MDTTFYDVIVVGMGAMGSAAVYQLAKKGAKVLGIDQLNPPHTLGSSHGDTRITRQAIGEGEEYVPLVLRSYEIFQELEKLTGRHLLKITGGLIISSQNKTAFCHVPKFFENTTNAAKKFNIKHEILSADQIRQKFPQFKVADNEIGYYENMAGYLRPEECVAAHLEMAKKHGATLKTYEKVLSYVSNGDKVKVTTERGEYIGKKLIITAGAYLPNLLAKNYSQNFKIERQVIYWWEPKDKHENYLNDKMPIFIWELPDKTQGIYGFPCTEPGSGVKIATEQSEYSTTTDDVDRRVTKEETQVMYEKFVKPYFPGLTNNCVKSAVCLYTVTPDSGFVIDWHPEHKNVIIGSPCSGHGFKHSAGIGEILAEMSLKGKSTLDISKFSFSRFKKNPTPKL